MRKLLIGALMLAASATASASQFTFEACNTDMRIRFDDIAETIWLDIYNDGTGQWDWTVNRIASTLVVNTQTPEQFMQDFLDDVEVKLNSYCEANGGGEIPTDFMGLVKYHVKNSLVYNEESNSVTFK